jgi:hypothetical protein
MPRRAGRAEDGGEVAAMTPPPNLLDDERALWDAAAKATQEEWCIVHDGLYEWHRSPFNPWRRILIGTPKPEHSRPEVITGHFIAKIEEGANGHEIAIANGRHIIAANPAAVMRLLQRLSDLRGAREKGGA